MAYPAGLGWWDKTWNPIGGCSHASPGCRNCYAQFEAGTRQTRHRIPLHENVTDWRRGRPVFNGHLTVLPPRHAGWTWPLRWRGADHPVLGEGEPSLIFVGDMADLFHENRPVAVVHEVVSTIAASAHIGQLLTKRADRMADFFEAVPAQTLRRWQQKLWLGFSAERQKEFDDRWAHASRLAQRGWIVFASIAPMLAPVRLPVDFLARHERAWVICSGEQGRGARYMDPTWARALRDQCAAADVPFFLLQMSTRKPIPPDLFVRQFPAVGNDR